MSPTGNGFSFDYLVVGGGSSGAIIARRLADARVGSVALLEAGPADEGVPCLMDVSLLTEQPEALDWGYMASKLAGAPSELKYSRARVLGGCGNHNDCAWLTPPDCDFREWERNGATGWGPGGIQTALQKLRRQVWAETPVAANPVSVAFLRGGRDIGLPAAQFSNSITTGVGMMPLNAKGRFRQSSSVAYLHPLSSLPDNLTLLTETMVTRIVFEGTRAAGCETTRGFIAAQAEVILCAGSVQTPHLLMVSGVGPAPALRALGIEIAADLPGVGQNLRDHSSSSLVFRAARPLVKPTVTPYEAMALVTIDQDAPAPDCCLQLGLTRPNPNGRLDLRDVQNADNFTIAVNPTRPRSRGQLTIASQDIRVAPRIDLNYLSDDEGYDRRIMADGLRMARKLANAPSMVDITTGEIAPGPDVTGDREIYEYFLTQNLETLYHPAGTCRMGGADDSDCVVAPDLKVRKLSGLRVCDASIFPTMVTVNINCPVMIVAERAAELIISSARAR